MVIDAHGAKQHLIYDADGNLTAAYVVGELNWDGVINSIDIDPLILAIADPGESQHQYAYCDIPNGDASGHGPVNSLDSDAFVSLLTGENAALYAWYT